MIFIYSDLEELSPTAAIPIGKDELLENITVVLKNPSTNPDITVKVNLKDDPAPDRGM